ncbi:MAG: hypothetical protein RL308_1002 [Bacteroidota bacterium]|jgi:acetyltransferase-like isoleucine patch superfamily enzyme
MGMILIEVLRKVKKLIFSEKPTNYVFTKDLLIQDNVSVGDYTYGMPKVHFLDGGTQLIIGKFCSIAGEVTIFLGGNHRVDWFTTYPFNVLHESFPEARDIVGHPSTKGDVHIKNDVWIGSGSKILSGVTIGNGAVIAANSLVSKNVGDYEIWGGNPAKFIKHRFNPEIIDLLLKMEWWNWPMSKINKNVHLLCSGDVIKLKELK